MANLGTHIGASFAGTFFCGALAGCFAEFCTLPLDVAKVRLQLQRNTFTVDGVSSVKYKGLVGTMVTIAKEEGLPALWKGITPGLQRQFIFGGLRIALYESFKLFLADALLIGDFPILQKVLAGLLTGTVAIIVANPTDLVKVRLQAEAKLPPGVPKCYLGALDAYVTIFRQEGVLALWTGLGPNIVRKALVSAAELAGYDNVKLAVLAIPGFIDDALTHMLAGLGAGFFAVCIGSPVDVVKSRMTGDTLYTKTPSIVL